MDFMWTFEHVGSAGVVLLIANQYKCKEGSSVVIGLSPLTILIHELSKETFSHKRQFDLPGVQLYYLISTPFVLSCMQHKRQRCIIVLQEHALGFR
jgi:hypothetical protein